MSDTSTPTGPSADIPAAGSDSPAAGIETASDAKPARKPRGRPSKSRGASKTADDGGARWTIRGVALPARKLAVAEAQRRNQPIGDFIEDAILSAVRGLPAAGGDNAATGNGPTSAGLPAQPLQATIEKLVERIEALEQDRKKGLLVRLFGG